MRNQINTSTAEDDDMPASQVLPEFKRKQLRSGSKTGPIVRSEKQARAIMLAEARKEGYPIPKRSGAKRSFTKVSNK